MSKPPSDKTLLRRANAKIRRLERLLETMKNQSDMYRARATKAETEVAEWRTRFDVLLRRDQTQVSGPPLPGTSPFTFTDPIIR